MSGADELMEHHRRLVAEVVEAMADTDVDDVCVDHHLLHLFSDVIEGMDQRLPALTDDERRAVASSVLSEMDQLLADAVADGVDPMVVAPRLDGLFVELAPCIPRSVARYRAVAQRAVSWLDANPEVVEALMNEAVDAELPPDQLLVALLEWMSSLEPDERREVNRRFHAEPGAAVREIVARAVLSHQLERFDGTE